MYSLALLGVTALLGSFLLTPLVRNQFLRWRIVDRPNARKAHRYPLPRTGGIAIAGAYLAAYLTLLLFGLKGGDVVWGARAEIWQLLPAVLIVFAYGLADDLLNLKPWHKIAGQIFAAAFAFFAGVHVTSFGGYALHPALSFPLTIAWLLLCTNAVNLIDGIDGLAAGIGLFATLTTLIAALLYGDMGLALATAPLAGALIGFLRYNFNPATIFLGDCGSLLIGFLLGCFGVIWSQKSTTILGMTAPLMALAIPLLDTALAIARRFLRRQPIFGADRGHIHHRLLDRGLTPRRAALVLYACCALGAAASLAVMRHNIAGYVIVLFCAATWMGIQHLGYVEFGTARRMLARGAFRGQLTAQIALETAESTLRTAATPEDCWTSLQRVSREFGFHHVQLQVESEIYEHRDPSAPLESWSIRIPLNGHGFIHLARPFNAAENATAVAPFADMLQRTLTPKLSLFAQLIALNDALHASAKNQKEPLPHIAP